jgi:large subunit ribosomal protein L13
MKSSIRTYVPDVQEVDRRWLLVDAEGHTLGRLASRIAFLLQGKHRPAYTPHLDTGDYVVVVNAEKLSFSEARGQRKKYYRHSGYPGGLTEMSLDEMMARHPERVLRLAVKGMLPRTRLGRQMIQKLKIHTGAEHPHGAQAPEVFDILSIR